MTTHDCKPIPITRDTDEVRGYLNQHYVWAQQARKSYAKQSTESLMSDYAHFRESKTPFGKAIASIMRDEIGRRVLQEEADEREAQEIEYEQD